MMSSCYKTLDVMGKEQYKEKLEPVRFSISDKPYSPSHTKKFCSDMSQWPKIKYGHIFGYFIYIQTRDLHSRTTTLGKQWKCRESARLSWLSSMLHGHDRVIHNTVVA